MRRILRTRYSRIRSVMILSGALLLRHSLGLEAEAAAIEKAVSQVLDEAIARAISSPEGCSSRLH